MYYTQGKTLAPKKATSRPYQIKGSWYYPQPYYEYVAEGIASFYGGGDIFHGRPTATGERFDMNGVTAAHTTLPLPCIAKVTNLENGRELIVKVNDRGPFVNGRLIDLSRRSAQLLGFEGKGLAKVRVVTLVPQSLALNGIDPSTVMIAQTSPTPDQNIKLASAAVPAIAERHLISSPLEVKEKIALEEENLPSEPVRIVEAPEVPVTKAKTFPGSGVRKKAPPSLFQTKQSVQASTGIFVHVGEFETHAKAQSLTQSLRDIASSPVEIVKNRGPKPYVASLGPLPSMANANQVLDQLINAGHLISRIVIQR